MTANNYNNNGLNNGNAIASVSDDKKIKLGIFGATGMVGQELLKVLTQRDFPISTIRLFASEKSAGKKVDTTWGNIKIENADKVDYSELDIAFFAIGGSWPAVNAPKAAAAGCYVIDNSSTFRYDENIPLIIPEINPNALQDSMIIANPNCTTAIAAIPLWVIYQNYGLKKIIISTYQATSGAGNQGMKELLSETKNYLEGKEPDNKVFSYPIPFNVIPHIDKFLENDYTKEEMKVVWETKKIFGLGKDSSDIAISCTCVRIPTLRTHSESIIVETQKDINPTDIMQMLEATAGVDVKDDIDNNIYPMPLTASKKYNVEVGRIRQSLIFGNKGLEFFVSGDQILKGAALNAVQIGELVFRQRFLK